MSDPIRFPRSGGGLTIDYQPHRANYETVESFLAGTMNDVAFPSDEDRARAIAECSLWVIQWYPETPIGFFRVAASTFDRALALALAIDDEDRGLNG